MKTRDRLILWVAGLLFFGLLASCAAQPTPSSGDASSRHTQAVQTVSARLTLDAGGTAVALLTQMAQATYTPVLDYGFTSTPTPWQDNSTPLLPTQTPLPTPTTSSIPCDWLEFISNVTVPDGKVYLPGAQFTKTWRVRNIGSCTWTRDYDLVFVGGDQMDGYAVIPLIGDFPPGTLVDLSVSLTAPTSDGIHTGYWQLRNSGHVPFGGGDNADQSLSVRIEVEVVDDILYDMAANYCKADWTNSRLSLQCPTSIEDELIGFVYKDDSPRLETGDREEKPALVTHPDIGGWMRFDFLGEQGLVAGAFPDRLIENGDRFETVIGCMYGHADCDVLFYLLLQKPNGSYDILASWQEYYDGEVTTVSYDLSEWAGREISLILVVSANGSAQDDYAFWLHPRLLR